MWFADQMYAHGMLQLPPHWWFYGVGRWASCQIRAGNAGTFSPPPRFSDPDMHHGTCVRHVSWCMPGLLTSGFLWSWWRENVPGIPGACATRNFAYLVRGPWIICLDISVYSWVLASSTENQICGALSSWVPCSEYMLINIIPFHHYWNTHNCKNAAISFDVETTYNIRKIIISQICK